MFMAKLCTFMMSIAALNFKKKYIFNIKTKSEKCFCSLDSTVLYVCGFFLAYAPLKQYSSDFRVSLGHTKAVRRLGDLLVSHAKGFLSDSWRPLSTSGRDISLVLLCDSVDIIVSELFAA